MNPQAYSRVFSALVKQHKGQYGGMIDNATTQQLSDHAKYMMSRMEKVGNKKHGGAMTEAQYNEMIDKTISGMEKGTAKVAKREVDYADSLGIHKQLKRIGENVIGLGGKLTKEQSEFLQKSGQNVADQEWFRYNKKNGEAMIRERVAASNPVTGIKPLTMKGPHTKATDSSKASYVKGNATSSGKGANAAPQVPVVTMPNPVGPKANSNQKINSNKAVRAWHQGRHARDWGLTRAVNGAKKVNAGDGDFWSKTGGHIKNVADAYWNGGKNGWRKHTKRGVAVGTGGLMAADALIDDNE